MQRSENNDWKSVGLVILAIRFVQGWIFWGGGSRRFIYAPQKLDPYAAEWMANKLQSAMPGALLDVGIVINFLLHHFVLLYAAIIIFSLVELLSGLALIFGCFTRAAGLTTVLLSISLMLIFGWEGSTCLDEWTMAVSNLAMGFTLLLSGSPIYSVDSWLLHRYPHLMSRRWFVISASGPLSISNLKRVALGCVVFTIIFTVGTYNYYRGAIISRYHAGRVSAVQYHISLSRGDLKSDGSVVFSMYVDAGNTAIPANILKIELLNEKERVIESWTGEMLSNLPVNSINNEYLYNRIVTGPFGVVAPVSAKARVALSPAIKPLHVTPGHYKLLIYTVNGYRSELILDYSHHYDYTDPRH